MAYGIKKTEAGHNNGKSRWVSRRDAKKGAKKVRRVNDLEAVRWDGRA